MYGVAYRLDVPRRVLSATPYRNGLEHGLARQWSADGEGLISFYRIRHGTGVDLWWQETFTDPPRPYLAEVRFARRPASRLEWLLNEDQRSVYEERHWRGGKLHGIERQWTPQGRLRRGFPRFYVNGELVTKLAYERARAKDASLPACGRTTIETSARGRQKWLGGCVRSGTGGMVHPCGNSAAECSRNSASRGTCDRFEKALIPQDNASDGAG
jgi:hypothetical protein